MMPRFRVRSKGLVTGRVSSVGLGLGSLLSLSSVAGGLRVCTVAHVFTHACSASEIGLVLSILHSPKEDMHRNRVIERYRALCVLCFLALPTESVTFHLPWHILGDRMSPHIRARDRDHRGV